MAKAIAIIIAFSIKVACVMGSFNAVPKQAHWICCLLKRDCTTPIVVAPKIIKVMTNTWNTPILIKSNTPNASSSQLQPAPASSSHRAVLQFPFQHALPGGIAERAAGAAAAAAGGAVALAA